MKYNIGDKVRIKSIDWYNKNKGNADKTNSVWCEDGGAWFFYHMSQYCGKIMTIKNVWSLSYTLEGSDSRWTDEMIEGLVEEETKNWTHTSIPDGPYTVTCDSPSMNDSMSKNNIHNEIILPKGYIFKDENGNVINATKIVLEKKKKEYPKTYKECCKVLGIEGGRLMFNSKDITEYEENLVCKIGKLEHIIVCRNAYWKIAGEEMGLGKPWEPNWEGEGWYVIVNHRGDIVTDIQWHANAILAFPTAEIRDAFKENFDPDIEICKELL